jgi:hypothetical protein
VASRNPLVARTTQLVARLDRRIGLRASAATLAWLMTVGAVALYGPRWAIALMVTAALAAGVVAKAKRRLLVSAVAAPVVAVLSLGVAVAEKPSARQTAKPTRQIVLEASSEASDLTTHAAWGHALSVASHDELLVRLRLRNPTSRRTPPVLLEARGLGLRNSLELAYGGSLEPLRGLGTSIALHAPAGEEAQAIPDLTRLTALGPRRDAQANLLLNAAAARRLVASGDTASLVALSPLAPHQSLVASFPATVRTAGFAHIAFGTTVRLTNLTIRDARPSAIVAARPGDGLRIVSTLEDPGREPVGVFTRLVVRHNTGIVSLTLLGASSLTEAPYRIGEAIVRGVSPIHGVRVVPGTTELVPSRQAGCSALPTKRLPDGLTEGGIDVGTIGSFVPKGACQRPLTLQYLVTEARAE